MAKKLIACNLSHGIILEVGDKRVTIRGSNSFLKPNANGFFRGTGAPLSELGYATTAVDAAFWDAWLAAGKNSTLDIVTKRRIYAQGT